MRMRFAGELLSSLIKRGGGETKAPAVEAGATNVMEHERTLTDMTLHQTANQSTTDELLSAFGSGRAKHPAAMWLQAMLKRAQKEGRFAIVDELTPDRAALLLANNEQNRNIVASNVAKMANDIAEGRWELNGQTVVVSEDGRLNDGQHRSLAVVQANKAIRTFFAFGLNHDTRLTTDTGAKKTVGGILSMKGEVDPNVLAAVARCVWQYDNHGIISRQSYLYPTTAALLHFIEQHADLADSVRFVPGSSTSRIGGKTLLAFCHYVLARTNSEKADAFITNLVEGASLQKGDPILVARNRLAEEVGRRSLPVTRAEVVFRAWNSHVRGLKISKIQLTGEFPEILTPKD